MLDYIRILHYSKGLGLSGRRIADELNVSKSGVNDFLKAFDEHSSLGWPLPVGITNLAVYEAVYGSRPGRQKDAGFCLPNFEDIAKKLKKPNMTLQYLWNHYSWKCEASGEKAYSYRQFCRLYDDWCNLHGHQFHFTTAPGESMEVDFAGKTFSVTDPFTREEQTVSVFVAVLPYSQAIYAEGMLRLTEAYWIDVNNHALQDFGGVPSVVKCDNCRHPVTANWDWVEPELNKAYAEWAEWNGTYILPAKVRRPTYKPSVEGAVGILERGIFHDLNAVPFFSLEDFKAMLHRKVQEVNDRPSVKTQVSRSQLLEEERKALMPLPDTCYEYAETRTAKVNRTSHVQFSNAYYSVDYRYANKAVTVRAAAARVRIYSVQGELLADWPRAERRGQYQTNPDHMPAWYREIADADAMQFISRGGTDWPGCVKVHSGASEKLQGSRPGFQKISWGSSPCGQVR